MKIYPYMVLVALLIMSGCSTRSPARDTRTEEQKKEDRMAHMEYQLRVMQMETLRRGR